MRKVRDGMKITMKIAVHLRRCQSTAWTATDCNADACAKIFQALQKVQQQQAKRPLAVSENGKYNKKIRQSATPTLVPKEVELVTLHSSENEYKNDTDTSLCSIDDLLKSDEE